MTTPLDEGERYVHTVEVVGSSPTLPTDDDWYCSDLDLGTLRAGQSRVISGLPNRTYHGLPCPSKSSLWDLRARGPAWYAQRHVHKSQFPFSSGALQLGVIVHLALQWGPSEYKSEVTEIPADFTTAGGSLSSSKSARDWAAAQDPDRPFAAPADLATTDEMMQEFFRNTAARDLYERITAHELSVLQRRPDGHAVRIRIDAMTECGMLVDWKSTRDARPRDTFGMAAAKHGYQYQSALYSQVAAAAGISDGGRITFVALSTTPSYEVQVLTLPERAVRIAEQWIAEDLDEIADRTATDNWLPSGYGEITEVSMPEWSLKGRTE